MPSFPTSSSPLFRMLDPERFEALLDAFACDPGPQLEQLLDAYDAVLGEALELRPGAIEALEAVKRAGLSAGEGIGDLRRHFRPRLRLLRP